VSERLAKTIKAIPRHITSPYVFRTKKGHSFRVMRTAFENACPKAKIVGFRFHDLRHSFASWLIGNGESLAYVRDQMGHSSIQITVDTYGHLIPGANRQAVNRLDDAEWRTTGGKSATPAHPSPSRAKSPEGGEVRIALN
jgi:integrase